MPSNPPDSLFKVIGEAHRCALAFLLACPMVAAIPLVAEMVQHVAEISSGLYVSMDAAKAAAEDPLRLVLGVIKVMAMGLMGYWVPRYIALGFSPARALQHDSQAVKTFTPYFVFSLALVVFDLFVKPKLYEGWSGGAKTLAGSLDFFAFLLLGSALAAWAAAAALGNRAIGAAQSVAVMRGHINWATALTFLGMLPLMIVHYGLFLWAVGQPTVIVWALCLLDSLVVAALAALLAALSYLGARRAATAKGLSLLPTPPSAP